MSNSTSSISVGVIGLGFIGATHVRAYQSARAAGFPCVLGAVADRDARRLTGRVAAAGNIDTGAGGEGERLFDPAEVRGYTSAQDLLGDERIGLVSICTHTDTHVDLAVAALEAGKHVLVEKPVAISSAGVQRVADAARSSGRLCMPAMCMRFWPGWSWLKDRVRERTFGRVLSASFERLGAAPGWSAFYADHARSGGALMDLHIHDADFVRFCFGEPAAVSSAGGPMHVTTIYRFLDDDAPRHVVAQGGQDLAPGSDFRMRYTVAFEQATADFDLARPSPLTLVQDGGKADVALPGESGYELQVRHLVTAIAQGRRNEDLVATIDDAVAVTRMLEAELESCTRGREVLLEGPRTRTPTV